MAQFTLLLRGEEVDFKSFSPEDYQKLIEEFNRFNEKLLSGKKLIGSASLKGSSGKTLKLKEGRLAIDGPYCETKEAITGIFIFEAENQEEAIALAKECPFLPIGGSVEVMESPQVEIERTFKSE